MLPDQRETGNSNSNITGTFATLQKIQCMLALPNNKKKKDWRLVYVIILYA